MKEIEVNTTTINFGPQHPAAHGVLRLVVESAIRIIVPVIFIVLIGEIVVQSFLGRRGSYPIYT